MRKTNLFVVGAPGVGKTTALTKLLDPWSKSLVEKPKWTLSPPVAMVGHYGQGTFGGGDTVPYDGAVDAVKYWSRHLLTDPRYSLFVFDGDRFSTKSVLELVSVQCLDHTFENPSYCIHMTASEEALAERRAKRGSTQNEAWMKGRATKAARFAAMFEGNCIEIETTNMSPDEVADALREYI